MASGSAIRGSRVGAGPMGEAERGDAAPRVAISYFCADGHETRPAFAHDAEIPAEWDCPKCGQPAGRNEQAPPVQAKTEPYKTHLAYVRERRVDEDLDETLHRALDRLHAEFEI